MLKSKGDDVECGRNIQGCVALCGQGHPSVGYSVDKALGSEQLIIEFQRE